MKRRKIRGAKAYKALTQKALSKVNRQLLRLHTQYDKAARFPGRKRASLLKRIAILDEKSKRIRGLPI